MCHRLCVRTATKLVKQRVRKFHHKRQIIIQDEILRLLKVEFIREVLYSNWLSNVVVVLKKMEKLRVWVDFTDLNDLCSKTSLLFSYINQIVDTTSQHGLLSFMDAFSRYNQIPMYSPNYEKPHLSLYKACTIIMSCYLDLKTPRQHINAWWQKYSNLF